MPRPDCHAPNVHLLPGICEDETGNKLLHIAGMRSSKGQSETNRDIPIAVCKENGMISEASAEARLLRAVLASTQSTIA